MHVLFHSKDFAESVGKEKGSVNIELRDHYLFASQFDATYRPISYYSRSKEKEIDRRKARRAGGRKLENITSKRWRDYQVDYNYFRGIEVRADSQTIHRRPYT